MDALSIEPYDPATRSSLPPVKSSDNTKQKIAALGLNVSEGSTDESIDAVLVEFQGYLIQQMMQTMRESVPEGDLFERSTGEDIFESMLDETYSKEMSRGMGGLGLTEALRFQLGLDDPMAKKPEVSPVEAEKDSSAIDETVLGLLSDTISPLRSTKGDSCS